MDRKLLLLALLGVAFARPQSSQELFSTETSNSVESIETSPVDETVSELNSLLEQSTTNTNPQILPKVRNVHPITGCRRWVQTYITTCTNPKMRQTVSCRSIEQNIREQRCILKVISKLQDMKPQLAKIFPKINTISIPQLLTKLIIIRSNLPVELLQNRFQTIDKDVINTIKQALLVKVVNSNILDVIMPINKQLTTRHVISNEDMVEEVKEILNLRHPELMPIVKILSETIISTPLPTQRPIHPIDVIVMVATFSKQLHHLVKTSKIATPQEIKTEIISFLETKTNEDILRKLEVVNPKIIQSQSPVVSIINDVKLSVINELQVLDSQSIAEVIPSIIRIVQKLRHRQHSGESIESVESFENSHENYADQILSKVVRNSPQLKQYMHQLSQSQSEIVASGTKSVTIRALDVLVMAALHDEQLKTLVRNNASPAELEAEIISFIRSQTDEDLTMMLAPIIESDVTYGFWSSVWNGIQKTAVKVFENTPAGMVTKAVVKGLGGKWPSRRNLVTPVTSHSSNGRESYADNMVRKIISLYPELKPTMQALTENNVEKIDTVKGTITIRPFDVLLMVLTYDRQLIQEFDNLSATELKQEIIFFISRQSDQQLKIWLQSIISTESQTDGWFSSIVKSLKKPAIKIAKSVGKELLKDAASSVLGNVLGRRQMPVREISPVMNTQSDAFPINTEPEDTGLASFIRSQIITKYPHLETTIDYLYDNNVEVVNMEKNIKIRPFDTLLMITMYDHQLLQLIRSDVTTDIKHEILRFLDLTTEDEMISMLQDVLPIVPGMTPPTSMLHSLKSIVNTGKNVLRKALENITPEDLLKTLKPIAEEFSYDDESYYTEMDYELPHDKEFCLLRKSQLMYLCQEKNIPECHIFGNVFTQICETMHYSHNLPGVTHTELTPNMYPGNSGSPVMADPINMAPNTITGNNQPSTITTQTRFFNKIKNAFNKLVNAAKKVDLKKDLPNLLKKGSCKLWRKVRDIKCKGVISQQCHTLKNAINNKC